MSREEIRAYAIALRNALYSPDVLLTAMSLPSDEPHIMRDALFGHDVALIEKFLVAVHARGMGNSIR